MGKIIEGVWDCVYCGAKKVRGGLRECPQCGHPRDENVTFYIDNPKNYIYDEKAAAKACTGMCGCMHQTRRKAKRFFRLISSIIAVAAIIILIAIIWRIIR